MSDTLCDPFKDCPPDTDLGPWDSISWDASCQGTTGTTSSKLLARQIDLDCRRTDFKLFTPVIWPRRKQMPRSGWGSKARS